MTYRSLDPAKITATAVALEARVAARFPNSGLRRVAGEITVFSRDTAREAAALTPPIWPLRMFIAAVVVAGGAFFLRIGTILPFNRISAEVAGSVQGIEAGLNTAILAGLGLTALIRLEARLKRHRVARSLHQLRAVIHVIDMHQITKDPAALGPDYQPTDVSPVRNLTAAELERYLDYCSEMLAITGKLAALYAQAVPDEGVAQAVNDIETLGSNLSRKIWQKITLLHAQGTPPPAPGRRRRA